MKLIAATKNKGKLKEITQILGDIYQITSMQELGIDIEVVEDGTTFEENAIKKATEIMRACNIPTLADDSGLEVDALGGAPGVYSARYAGENATDTDRISKLLTELDGLPKEQRTARFTAAVAIAFPDGRVITAQGHCEGYIANVPSGNGGFGYDPIFVVTEYGKTFAELDSQTKNQISHRAKAIEKIKILL